MSTLTTRTFNDLLRLYRSERPWLFHEDRSCRLCNAEGAIKYSERHFICVCCATARGDELLPSVAKYEARERSWAELREANAREERSRA